MKRIAIAVAVAFWAAVAAGATAQDVKLPLGFWRGWVDSPGGELPFEMEFFEGGAWCSVSIVNGAERIVVPDVVRDNGEVVIRIPHYDAELRGGLTADGERARLDGTWSRTARDGTRIEMPFHARAGEVRRFIAQSPPAEGVSIAGRWRVEMAESGTVIAEFGPGDMLGTVVGTFMSPTGDLGHLDGIIDGRTVKLSTFDGSHAFLFVAEIGEDGGLTGEFYSGPKFHESWTAVRDDGAALPDGFSDVTWDSSVDVWSLEFPNDAGEQVTLEKVLGGRMGVVLEVMGTWCPNCHDAARMIEELRDEIPNRQMVRVVSLAFEYTADRERSLRQIAAYKERFGITDPILLTGLAKKEEVVRVLSGLSEMKSFPTTLFVAADGRVIGVHSGFAGPATGAEYKRLRERYKELMGELAGK